MGMWGYYPEQSDDVCDEYNTILYDVGIDFEDSELPGRFDDTGKCIFTLEQTELINNRLKELYDGINSCTCTYVGVVRRLSQEGLVIRDDIWEIAIECINHYIEHSPPETEEEFEIASQMKTEMLEKNIKTSFVGLNSALNT